MVLKPGVIKQITRAVHEHLSLSASHAVISCVLVMCAKRQ